MTPIPPSLQLLIDEVTGDRYQSDQRAFKAKRGYVVDALRALGMHDPEISKMLGVTKQFIGREYPKKVSKT